MNKKTKPRYVYIVTFFFFFIILENVSLFLFFVDVINIDKPLEESSEHILCQYNAILLRLSQLKPITNGVTVKFNRQVLVPKKLNFHKDDKFIFDDTDKYRFLKFYRDTPYDVERIIRSISIFLIKKYNATWLLSRKNQSYFNGFIRDVVKTINNEYKP